MEEKCQNGNLNVKLKSIFREEIKWTVTIVTLIFAVAGYYFVIKGRLDMTEYQVKAIQEARVIKWTEQDKLTADQQKTLEDIKTDIAIIKEKINSIDKKMR